MAAMLIGVGAGCDKPSHRLNAASPDRPQTPATPQFHLNQAQPKLPTIKLWLGTQQLDTEVALTLPQVSTGMMFRTNMLENEAMIFVFAEPRPREFYMKNCVVPLSAAYMDSDGTILEIVSLVPGVEVPVASQSDKVQFVLETKQGWFERNKVPVGSVIRTERGSLRETFAGLAKLR
jgi:uncharacterized membrane protein (UPF0127 family)